MTTEFELIRRHFTRPPTHTEISIGDDAAVLRPKGSSELVVSTDMLVAGTHFLPNTDPESLGWRALAVNLSDLAAMGAEPRWAFLALALPEPDEEWLSAFSRGFFAAADAYGVDLAGGDTTRGPLTLSPTVIGEIPAGSALLRAGAKLGDDIWVSGNPGRAALGLAHLQGRITLDGSNEAGCLSALLRPQPRIALGLALRGVAGAAIDISDGLLADLGRILEASGVAADVYDPELPWGGLPIDAQEDEQLRDCLLAGGDDYELVFCAAPDQRLTIAGIADRLALPLARIGRIVEGAAGSLRLLDDDDVELPVGRRGFDHFA